MSIFYAVLSTSYLCMSRSFLQHSISWEEAGKTKIHQNGFVLSLLMLLQKVHFIPLGKMSIFLILVFIAELPASGNRPQLPSSLLARTGDKLPAVDRAISLAGEDLVNDLQGFSSDLNAVIFFECRRPRAAKEHHLLTLYYEVEATHLEPLAPR